MKTLIQPALMCRHSLSAQVFGHEGEAVRREVDCEAVEVANSTAALLSLEVRNTVELPPERSTSSSFSSSLPSLAGPPLVRDAHEWLS